MLPFALRFLHLFIFFKLFVCLFVFHEYSFWINKVSSHLFCETANRMQSTKLSLLVLLLLRLLLLLLLVMLLLLLLLLLLLRRRRRKKKKKRRRNGGENCVAAAATITTTTKTPTVTVMLMLMLQCHSVQRCISSVYARFDNLVDWRSAPIT